MKSKFANLNFEGVEVLSKEETKKVKGGYIPAGSVPNLGTTWRNISCSGQVAFDYAPVNYGFLPWTAQVTQNGCASFAARQQACANALPANVTLNVQTLGAGYC